MKLKDLASIMIEDLTKEVSVKELFKGYGRRTYDVVNVLLAANIIYKPTKHTVKLVETKPEWINKNVTTVESKGAITSVKNYGTQIIVESTAPGFRFI